MDCFISYTSSDGHLARLIKRRLEDQNVSVFMAELSISPGQRWTDEIRKALKSSSWIIFLASRSACRSPYVQQEVGAAIFGGKSIVPVIWDIDPHELPGWTNQYQALDIRNVRKVDEMIRKIAADIKADKLIGAIVAGAILAALIYIAVED